MGEGDGGSYEHCPPRRNPLLHKMKIVVHLNFVSTRLSAMHIEFIDDFVARFQFPTPMQNAK